MLPYYAASPAAARKYLRKWRDNLPPTACVRGAVILAEPPEEHRVVLQSWYIKHGEWRHPTGERRDLVLPDLAPARIARVIDRAIADWVAQGDVFDQDEKRDGGVSLHLEGADLADLSAALGHVQAPNPWWVLYPEG